MTPRQLGRRVEYWQRKLHDLGLQNWDLNVSVVDEPEGRPGSHASVTVSQHYDSAWIEFEADSLTELDQRNIDKIIVHELLHIIFRDYEAVIEEVSTDLGMAQRMAWNNLREHEMEGVIERLARTIVTLHGS